MAKFIIRSVVIAVALLFALIVLWYYRDSRMFIILFPVMIGALCLIGWVMCGYGYKRVELNDDGIIVRSKLVPWGKIFLVDVIHICFRFHYYTEKRNKYYDIPFFVPVEYINKENLEFAVRKLPPDIFTEKAQYVFKRIEDDILPW